MSVTRRDLLMTAAAAAALTAMPRPLRAHFGGRRPVPVPTIRDPRIRELAMQGLDAARTAGAAYADVRLSHERERTFGWVVKDDESLGVGVRALVDGYWGFAAGPVWSPDEMARLAAAAVHQAKVVALGKPRVVDLAPAPVVRDGHWETPVAADPFATPPLEVQDFIAGLRMYLGRLVRGYGHGASWNTIFVDLEKAFASTNGSYCTQRLQRVHPSFGFNITTRDPRDGSNRSLQMLTTVGMGWEHVRDAPLREELQRLFEDMKADLALPRKAIEVGRWDTVMDPITVARILDGTIGRATELDRALGYEANAGGTSFLNDPFAMLGSFTVGAPLLTVTANRSEPGGAATVKWDDEGVEPEDFTLVKDGVLTDFQTTRESAGWMKAGYAPGGLPFRSHGCAAAPTAIEPPLQRTPNLALQPGAEARTLEALESKLTDGISLHDGQPSLDFQGLDGILTGRMYEVKKGRRTARLGDAGILFRAPELWKGLTALGDASSARRYGFQTTKGEPDQQEFHSVTAVPAAFRQLTIIDASRKA